LSVNINYIHIERLIQMNSQSNKDLTTLGGGSSGTKVRKVTPKAFDKSLSLGGP